MKETTDDFTVVSGEAVSGDERVALYVMAGDYERRGLVQDSMTDTYEPSGGVTEAQYLVSGARVVWKSASSSPISTGTFDSDLRVTMALPNLIQSTSAVVDLASGELLESVTFHPNGVRETLVSNREVVGFALEPVGFTGKEDDAEVGLVYFGERYLMPHLGRWASADPLQTHGGGGGEFGNSYHYVSGNVLQARDPLGLQAGLTAAEKAKLDAGAPGSLTQVREASTTAALNPTVPTASSGVTIGYGYDVRGQPSRDSVFNDMIAIGMSVSHANTIADAHDAESQQSALSTIQSAGISITADQADKLYQRIQQRYEDRARDAMLAAGVSEERWNSLDSDVREFLADIAYVGRPLQGRRGEYAAEILNNESLNTAGQLVAMHSLNRVIRTSNTLNNQGQPTGRQFSGQRGYEVRRHWLNARIREHAEPSATGGGLTPEVMNAAREQIQSIRSQENAARTSNPNLGPIIPSP